MHEPRIRSSIAGRIHGFFAPLQKALRVGKRAGFFRMTSGRKKKNFSVDFFGLQFTALDLGE